MARLLTHHRMQRFVAMIVVVVLVLSVASLPNRPLHAKVPSLDQIRVALFIPARGTVPAVTVSSESPMALFYRGPSGATAWLSAEGRFRASLDQYAIIVAETRQYEEASRLQRQISGLARGASIFEMGQGTGRVYLVAAGPYATKAEAEQARNAISRQLSAGSQLALELAGPHYLKAGSFPDLASAEEKASALSHAGLRAYPVIHADGDGKPAYSVWIGGAPDAAALNEARAAAQKLVPGIALSPADTGIPYLIKKKDVTDGAQSPMPHYVLQTSDMKLRVTSDSPIRLEERYGRSYRGSLEISQYEGGLTVINDLPFEQYLYSVVGSEMGGNWPLEALKAQAVAARTYALKQGMKYGVAHISDTTYDQAYKGISAETPATIEAVKQTEGEVLVDGKGSLIETLYSANAGGMTADESEIWGKTSLDYISPVPSPDHAAAEDVPFWDHVVLPDGTVGYIRTDFTRETGEANEAGLEILHVEGTNVNVRSAPYVDNAGNPPIAQVNEGDRLIRLGSVPESNAYSWLRGPYTGEQLLASINRVSGSRITGPLKTLEVSERGPSGRVTEVKANGKVIEVSAPDTYRSALNGLPSTRFEIEEMGNFAIAGSKGMTTRQQSGEPLYVLTGDQPDKPLPFEAETFLAMGKPKEARQLTQEPLFRFAGMGYGHGLGMSQWGAREMAEYMGYDYKKILLYYFKGATLVETE